MSEKRKRNLEKETKKKTSVKHGEKNLDN